MQAIVRPSERFPRILTPREAEIFDLILLGRSNKDCAERLGISARTVEVFRRRLMIKLNARNFAELMWLGILGQRPPAEWDAEPLPHPHLRGAEIELGPAAVRPAALE
ncbi:MAG: LuxR C-terminal-related transcriptional regulator [Devosia sp.]